MLQKPAFFIGLIVLVLGGAFVGGLLLSSGSISLSFTPVRSIRNMVEFGGVVNEKEMPFFPGTLDDIEWTGNESGLYGNRPVNLYIDDVFVQDELPGGSSLAGNYDISRVLSATARYRSSDGKVLSVPVVFMVENADETVYAPLHSNYQGTLDELANTLQSYSGQQASFTVLFQVIREHGCEEPLTTECAFQRNYFEVYSPNGFGPDGYREKTASGDNFFVLATSVPEEDN